MLYKVVGMGHIFLNESTYHAVHILDCLVFMCLGIFLGANLFLGACGHSCFYAHVLAMVVSQ